jgi:hypothetical protein
MGRRKRSKREDDAVDDELDNYEREWLSQRANSKVAPTNKRQKITEDAEANQLVGKNVLTNSLGVSDANTSSHAMPVSKTTRSV